MYALQNSSSTTLPTPKATSNALDKAYLATMKCVVVCKAFKKVAEEQTKFKQIKHQLKALGFNNEYAGQMADTLNNDMPARFSRKSRVTLGVFLPSTSAIYRFNSCIWLKISPGA